MSLIQSPLQTLVRTLAVAAALSGAAVSAQAQSYAGVLAQMSTYNSGSLCAANGVSGACDDSANGFKLVAGTALTDNWNLEGAFTRFGKTTSVDGAGRLDLEVEALVVAAVLKTRPLPRLMVTGKFGIAAVTAKAKTATADLDEQHPSLYLGLGLDYQVYKDISAVVGYDFTRAQVGGSKFGVHAWGIGAQMGF